MRSGQSVGFSFLLFFFSLPGSGFNGADEDDWNSFAALAVQEPDDSARAFRDDFDVWVAEAD